MIRILCLLALCCMAGCSGSSSENVSLKASVPYTAPNGYKVHVAPDNAFQIAMPSNWIAEESSQRMDGKDATIAAGAAVFGAGKRSSLVAQKMDGLSSVSVDGQTGSRILLAACRMTLYDAANYDRFRKESFDSFCSALSAQTATTTETKKDLPVGKADVMEASWKNQGMDFRLRSTFLRDAKDVVYEIDVCSADAPGRTPFDEAQILESFRPGK